MTVYIDGFLIEGLNPNSGVLCPVCGKDIGVYIWPCKLTPEYFDVFANYLYQYSYSDTPDYISPRCSDCMDRALAERNS